MALEMRIKDWEKFQHYKNRRPPWLKVYGTLLDDPEWYGLQGRDAWVLVNLWLLAREDDNKKGWLPPIEKIAFRLRMPVGELLLHLTNLIHWLDVDASKLLAACKQLAIPETETEAEAETETELPKQGEAYIGGTDLNVVRLPRGAA